MENVEKYEEVVKYYIKAISINPECIDAYLRRAKALMKLGRSNRRK